MKLKSAAGEQVTKDIEVLFQFSYTGTNPWQDSNLHLPRLKRSNPCLHHRPKTFAKDSPGNQREEPARGAKSPGTLCFGTTPPSLEL
jgi:hypothetical protein